MTTNGYCEGQKNEYSHLEIILSLELRRAIKHVMVKRQGTCSWNW